MEERIAPDVRSRAMAAARGASGFDVLIRGGSVVDVGCGEVRTADVGIVGSLIASVHEPGTRADAERTVEATGRFLAPGFMDLHVHFESSMLTPRGYAEAVLPRGTTTVFADPHELGNAAGLAGVRYAVDAARGLPLRFVFQAPSCVPPVPELELSSADFQDGDIAEMLSWAEVAGVAEVMDITGVLDRHPRMVDIVEAGLRSGKLVSGHAFGLSGGDLQAYLCAGISSDHENLSPDDVGARLRSGMTVELRGGIDHLLPGVVELLGRLPQLPTHIVTCTDDVFAEALLTEGGIDRLLRRLIELGLDPVHALQMATINGAYRLQRPDLGFVGAGRRADIVILDELRSVAVNEVFVDGALVAAEGQLVAELADPPATPPLDTLRVPRLEPEDFALRVAAPANGSVQLKTIERPLFTEWGSVGADVIDHRVVVPEGYLLQAAIHRYGRADAVPRLALLGGWGEWTGAIATTVSHDTHNLTVFGRDAHDMAIAANAVIDAGGGVAVAAGSEVLALLPLPIAGLLSPLPAAHVATAQAELEAAALEVAEFSTFLRKPLLQVMVSSLACLPGPHLTDVGLVDGSARQRVPSMLAVE